MTAADTGAVLAAVGVYLGIDDLDMTAVAVLTAADTRAVYAAPRIHGRALELDIFILLKNRQNSSTCRLFVVYCRFFTPKNN